MVPYRWSQIFLAVFLGVLAGLAGWQLLVRLWPVLVITFAGFAVAYLLDPLLLRLEAHGWSRAASVSLVATILVGLLVLAGILIIPALLGQISSMATQIPAYVEDLAQLVGPLDQALARLEAEFPALQDTDWLKQQLDQALAWLSGKVPTALQWVTGTLLTSLRAAGTVLLTLFIAFWFMLVLHPFRRGFQALFPERGAAELRSMDREISNMLGQYLRGIALTCLGIALVNSTLLAASGRYFGTQYALLLGAFAAVAYLVPYLGMLTACLLVGLLSYLTALHDAWIAVAVNVGIILVVNQIFDSFIMPRIVGRKVGLHPLAIVLALLAGAALLGVWGMILATPLAAAVKIALAHWVPVIAQPLPEEGLPKRRRPAPLALDLSRFAAQTWQAVRAAGEHVEQAGARLEQFARGTPAPTSPPPGPSGVSLETQESQDEDPGTPR